MWKPGPAHSTTSSRSTSAVTSAIGTMVRMRDIADRRGSPSSNIWARGRSSGCRRRRSAPRLRRCGRPRCAAARRSPRVLERGDHGSRASVRCSAVAPAGVEQDVVQVDAVDDDVGMLEPRVERRAGRDARRSRWPSSAVEHQHGLGAEVGLLQHRVADAEPVEHREDVGAELDAVADDAELGAPARARARACPCAPSASAAVSPPSPPPTTRMGSCLPANRASANQQSS